MVVVCIEDVGIAVDEDVAVAPNVIAVAAVVGTVKSSSSPPRATGRCLKTVPAFVRGCVIVLPEEPDVRSADVRYRYKNITCCVAC